MHEGQAGDRAHLQPLSRDVGQAGHDDRLDRQGLQVPHGTPQLVGAAESTVGEHDHVGAGGLDHLLRITRPPEDRDAGRCLLVGGGVVVERAEDGVAEPRLATQHGRDLVDVPRVTREDHFLLEVASLAAALDGAPQPQATEHEQRCPDHEDQQEEPPRQLVLGEVAADPHQAGAEHRRLDDALVLLGTRTEDVAGVATHDQPARRATRTGAARRPPRRSPGCRRVDRRRSDSGVPRAPRPWRRQAGSGRR